MENLGRVCCWIAALACFATACSLPLIAAYLEVAGPHWLVEHAAKEHARGHGSNLDVSFICSGVMLCISGIVLVCFAAGSPEKK